MAWTNPRTWVTDELVTAALMNAHVRDNLNYLNTQHEAKNSDEAVTSSTTLQDDADLVLVVAASEIWFMDLYLVMTAAPGGGVKLGWTVPSGTTMRWAPLNEVTSRWWMNDGNNSGTALLAAADTQTIASPAVTDVFGVNVKAIVTVGGTGGNVQLQWAQSSSNGTPSTMKAGSLFMAHRVST